MPESIEETPQETRSQGNIFDSVGRIPADTQSLTQWAIAPDYRAKFA